MNKLIKLAGIAWLSVTMSACAFMEKQSSEPVLVTETFVGVAGEKDTVSEQVMALREAGVLTNVRMTRSIPPQITATGPQHVLACIAEPGGIWLQEHNECEWMGNPTCENLGGSFDSCASAGRNTPESPVCVMNCVAVCSFDDAK